MTIAPEGLGAMLRIATTLIALIVLADLATATAETNQCFKSWSEAAAVVRQERLVAVEQLSKQARATLGGSIVKATLCSAGQRYFYRLVVRLPGGLMRHISLDARQPSER